MWAAKTMAQSELEASTQRPPDYTPPATRAAVLAQFDASYRAGRQQLMNKTDAEFAAPWTLNFADGDGGLTAFYAVAGIAVLAVSMITNYQYSPKREWAPGRASPSPA